MHTPAAYGSSRITSALGWLRLFSLANALFAVGCALLVPAVLDWLLLGGYAFWGLAWWALGLMALGAWPILIVSVAAVPTRGAGMPGVERVAAVLALAASMAGAAAGILTLPLAFPAYVGGFWGFYEWQYYLFYGLFAYIPTVFAPVLLGHAALAIVVARRSREPTAYVRLSFGALVLLAVALCSLVVQLTTSFDGWAWGLEGLAPAGYLLLALGARRERKGRLTAGPWPGPAAPSPGPWP